MAKKRKRRTARETVEFLSGAHKDLSLASELLKKMSFESDSAEVQEHAAKALAEIPRLQSEIRKIAAYYRGGPLGRSCRFGPRKISEP